MRAIRNMEPAWLKVNGGNFSLVEYRDKKGQLRPCYSLTKTECLYIATKFNDEARCAKGLCHGDRWLTYLHPCSARLVLLFFSRALTFGHLDIWTFGIFDYDIRDTNYELRRVCHILTHPPFIFGALKLGL